MAFCVEAAYNNKVDGDRTETYMIMMKNMAKEWEKNALRGKGNGMTPSGNIMQTSICTTDKYIH